MCFLEQTRKQERKKIKCEKGRQRVGGEHKVRVGKKRAGDRVARGGTLNTNVVSTSINMVY